MRHSICIIDDEIPAKGVEGIIDTELLNSSNLLFLLDQEISPWTDPSVKNLVQILLEYKENGIQVWDVFGYTNPAFYINTLDSSCFRADILIFDWDYPGTVSSHNSMDSLKEIMNRTFSLVFIFSKADKEPEIRQVMENPDFENFRNRLYYLDKNIDNIDQSPALLNAAKEQFVGNFSFRFGGELRVKSTQIMDKILTQLGKATLNDIRNYLNLDNNAEKHDLVIFLAERFKAGLIESDLSSLGPVAAKADPINQEIVKSIWSNRLYIPLDNTIDPATELVRRGDIVKIVDEYFLVISADCDLKRFWHKNFRSINLLPLHIVSRTDQELRELLIYCVSPADLHSGEFKFLNDKIGKLSEGPFLLPFLVINHEYTTFIIFPKELNYRTVTPPEEVTAMSKENRKNSQLKYSWWNNATKICSISEPFLTAIIQHTFAVINGFGVPDYPYPAMKEILNLFLSDFATGNTQ